MRGKVEKFNQNTSSEQLELTIVQQVNGSNDWLDELADGSYDIVITDKELDGGLTGHDVALKVKELGLDAKVVLISGQLKEVDKLNLDFTFCASKDDVIFARKPKFADFVDKLKNAMDPLQSLNL